MGDLAVLRDELMPPAPLRSVSYEVWCQCARLLLGWSDDAGDIRPDLYAAAMTPLAAARHVVLGPASSGGRSN